MEGLEPTRREAPDPKSSMSTNFITSAFQYNKNFTQLIGDSKILKFIINEKNNLVKRIKFIALQNIQVLTYHW
jgi:hypothetical protein